MDNGGRVLRIADGDTVVDIDQGLGGGVLRMCVADTDVLRSANPTDDPLGQGMFVLGPWVNRIVGGRFFTGDTFVTLSPNMAGEPHPIHGQAWLRPWRATRVEDHAVTLEFVGGGDEWPWAYRMEHRLEVEPGRLDCELRLLNQSRTPMPAALGFHPFFDRPARLTATVDGAWAARADAVPTHWEEREGFRSTDIDGVITDETHTGWDGRAIIETPDATIDLSSNLGMLHVFAARGRNSFCVEPTSAAPDAVNHEGRGLTMLEPGATAVATLRIAARLR